MFNFHERSVSGENRGGAGIYFEDENGEIYDTFALRRRVANI